MNEKVMNSTFAKDEQGRWRLSLEREELAAAMIANNVDGFLCGLMVADVNATGAVAPWEDPSRRYLKTLEALNHAIASLIRNAPGRFLVCFPDGESLNWVPEGESHSWIPESK